MTVRLAVLPGDGIGPEIVAAARQVLEAADATFGLGLKVHEAEVGFAALDRGGSTIRDDVLDLCRAADGVILGPVSHNDYPPPSQGGLNPSGVLRKQLDLYANIRPARTRSYLPAPIGRPFDLVIFRENTEGFYADRNMARGLGEFMPDEDMALSLRKITRHASARISKAAFAFAATRSRPRVAAVHKANVLHLTDGLFLEETRAAAARYPHVAYEEVIVDAMAALIVRSPDRFDTIVTTNMYGDILSDLAAELSGSLGLAPSLNVGRDHAMAQAQHGSAPDIAGKGIANPASMIGSVAMLLDWLGNRHDRKDLSRAAKRMDLALEAILADPGLRTPDLGGNGTTEAFARAVSQRVSDEG